MPQWSLQIQISYTNKGTVDWSGNAVCNVYYYPYSTDTPVGTSTVSVTIPAGQTIVVNHNITTDINVDIPGKAQLEVETYLEDPTTGAIYNYKRATFTLPDENMVEEGTISLVSATRL